MCVYANADAGVDVEVCTYRHIYVYVYIYIYIDVHDMYIKRRLKNLEYERTSLEVPHLSKEEARGRP